MEVPRHPLPEADARTLLRLFAEAIRPDPRRTVAEWAEANRVVTEGPHAGPGQETFQRCLVSHQLPPEPTPGSKTAREKRAVPLPGLA